MYYLISLGVSRAFGDYHLKTSRGKMKHKFTGDVVSAEPDVMELEIGAHHEFLVLASDGPTDVMKPRDVVNFVKDGLVEHQNLQRIAEEIVAEATKAR